MQNWLNYHHLYYFWRIAKLGSISEASRQLRLSQSTLSEQLKELEATLDAPLFERSGKRLELTEAGRVALEYAENIFTTGEELVDRLRNTAGQTLAKNRHFRLGTLDALPKKLQMELLEPLLDRSDVHLTVIEGSNSSLLRELNEHRLDLVISNAPVRTDLDPQLQNQRIAKLPICLVGLPSFYKYKKNFPHSLAGAPVYLPTHVGQLRAALSAYFDENQVEPLVRAEIEDLGLLRLFVLRGGGMAILPEVVVRDDLAAGTLKKIHSFENLDEGIYAITRSRKFPAPEIEILLSSFQSKSEG